MQNAFAVVESAVAIGAVTLAGWLATGDDASPSFSAIFNDDAGWATALVLTCYSATVLIVEPFFVGAGFAMYLNRRVELEAWDIEQEFRLAFAR